MSLDGREALIPSKIRPDIQHQHPTILMTDHKKFPQVQGGGSLILAWQVRNKPVLVIGGGAVSLYTSAPPLLFRLGVLTEFFGVLR